MDKADSLADINVVYPNVPEIDFGEEDQNTYYRFKQQATTNELLALTKHPNHVISTYAFWALADRKYTHLGDVYKETLARDSMVKYLSDCVAVEEKSSNTMYRRVLDNHLSNELDSLFTLQYNQLCEVILDSLKDSYTFYSVMLHNNVNPFLYTKIRQIALDEQNILAIIELAKYQRESDVKPLLQLGTNAMLVAIHHFPHKDFWNLLSSEISKQRPYPELLLAIAAYKNKEASEVLSKEYQRLKSLNDTTTIYILDMALSKHYCQLYDPIISSIWLQHHYIEPNIVDTLIAHTPTYAAQIFTEGLLNTDNIGTLQDILPPEICLPDSVKTINSYYAFIIYAEYAVYGEFHKGFNTDGRDDIIKSMLSTIAKYNQDDLAKVCQKLLPYSSDSYLLSILLQLIDKYHIPNCDKDMFNKLTKSSVGYNIYLASKILLATDLNLYKEKITEYVKHNKSFWQWSDSADMIRELFKDYNIDIEK